MCGMKFSDVLDGGPVKVVALESPFDRYDRWNPEAKPWGEDE